MERQLDTLLKGFEQTEIKDEMMLVATEDEPVLLVVLGVWPM
jgi:hypothetical protein